MVPADARRPTGFAWMNRLLQDPARPGAHLYTGPMFGERLRCFAKKTSHWCPYLRTIVFTI